MSDVWQERVIGENSALCSVYPDKNTGRDETTVCVLLSKL